MNYTPPESMNFSNACVYAATYARKNNIIVNLIIFDIVIVVFWTDSPLAVAKKAISQIEMKIAELRAQKDGLDFASRYRIAERIDKLTDYIKL